MQRRRKRGGELEEDRKSNKGAADETVSKE
jgi:hypothetical protein